MKKDGIQCLFCAHWKGSGTCEAYPDGIPTQILTNKHDHRKPFAGDKGIRFKPEGE